MTNRPRESPTSTVNLVPIFSPSEGYEGGGGGEAHRKGREDCVGRECGSGRANVGRRGKKGEKDGMRCGERRGVKAVFKG